MPLGTRKLLKDPQHLNAIEFERGLTTSQHGTKSSRKDQSVTKTNKSPSTKAVSNQKFHKPAQEKQSKNASPKQVISVVSMLTSEQRL